MNGQAFPGATELSTDRALTQDQFARLRQAFAALDLPKLRAHRDDFVPTDGSTWRLSYRDKLGADITIAIWSPDVATKQRGLDHYVRLFTITLSTVGVDPKTTYPVGQSP